MADDLFAPGALVQHISRGPIMTLVRYSYFYGERKAHCRWFEHPGELGEAFFLDAELTAYKPSRSIDQPAVTEKAVRLLLLQVGCVLLAPCLVWIAFRCTRLVHSADGIKSGRDV
jgi:uncharacterized protein YodC (DUF2158 family)